LPSTEETLKMQLLHGKHEPKADESASSNAKDGTQTSAPSKLFMDQLAGIFELDSRPESVEMRLMVFKEEWSRFVSPFVLLIL